MKKMINKAHFEGTVFSHSLEERITGDKSKNPGTPYIRGSVNVATDDEGLNVVSVVYSFTPQKTKTGKENPTYKTLKAIIDRDAKEEPMKVRVDTAIGVNDFYDAENELVSYKINDGGFIHEVKEFTTDRNSFEADTLITSVILKEADAEQEIPESLLIKGCVFNFKNDIIPVDFVIKDEQGIKYFLGFEPSSANPTFIKLWGKVNSSTIETRTSTETAFGEPSVNVSTKTFKEWVVTGASIETYDFGAEGVLTKEELKKAIDDRQVALSAELQRHTEYVNSQNKSSSIANAGSSTAADVSTGDFIF